MNKLPEKLKILDEHLGELDSNCGFSNCQKVVDSIIALLGISSEGTWKLFTDSQGKIRSNASWFKLAEGFADKRASYKIAEANNASVDLKAYWMKNLSKSITSWLVALTPNFEDEPFYGKKNIGIDFIIPESADRVIVVLSNSYVIRTLELHARLSLTQQMIFAKWLVELDFENKAQVHKTLWDSFDLEPLNKTFYKGISSFFVELKQHLATKKIYDDKHAAFFTNRLIGRIVFCWFLDKKGIINPDMKYFNTEKQEGTDYYRTKLETLFFRVFNTPIDERDALSIEEQKHLFPETSPKNLFNADIDFTTPFLNGGLFEKKENDKYGDPKLVFPADFFDRLYTFLRHYNFTTDESTSSFQQVAIDPEMLGRIFENLLAEQVEETGEQARKAKGAFYTPREIVDYMCKESLREYLKTKINESHDRDQRIEQLLDSKPHEWRDQQRNYRDKLKPYKAEIIDALDNVKVIDPACGSGAFPMGMLHILLQCYERLEPRFDPYKNKLEIIKNNLYGVDIEPMAVEISRLRAWLSLIVDEDADSKYIEPLPNLDFKFVCANSLIPLDNNGQQSFGDDAKLEDQILEIRDKYYNARKLSTKKKLREQYDKLISQKNQKSLFGKSRRQEQLETYHPFDPANVTQFFNPYFMFGVKYYDIVIGNPPYVKEYTYRKAFDGLRESSYYMGKMDLWYFFACVGLDILKENGIESFIATNNWISNFGAKKMRAKFLDQAVLKIFLDFGDYKIFESAGIQTMVYVVQKNSNNKEYDMKYGHLKKKTLTSDQLNEFIKSDFGISNELCDKTIYSFDKENFVGDSITFTNSANSNITGKIKAIANLLLAKEEVAQGIVLPQDFLNKKNNATLKNRYQVGDGIFVLSTDEVERLHLLKNELKLLKPYYLTPKFHKYYTEPENVHWIIYTDSSFKKSRRLKEYPNIKAHLDKFKSVITSDNKPYGLHRARKEEFFQGEKIVVARKCVEPKFAYSDFDCYVSATFYVIKTDRISMKYLVGVLNSTLMSYWLRHKGKMQGENYQIDKEPLLKIPIVGVTTKNKDITKSIESSVNKILQKRQTDLTSNISALEKEIDESVYQLYGLTPEEITIVEGENERK